MDKVAVIGSNSFSGASLVSYLLGLGLEVIGISRSPEYAPEMLPYMWHEHSRLSFHQLDINNDLERIVRLLKECRPTIVVNYAAQSMVAESWNSPEDWFQTNVVATIRLHDQLRQLDFLDKYIHVSTPEVYGNCVGSVREDAPYYPTTPYSVSRAACDMSLRTFYQSYKFPVLFTRAANVYGPGQQLYRIIPRTILSILTEKKLPLHGGGESIRSFIHIKDVAHGTWRVAQSGDTGSVYHLATPELISIRELVEKICTRLGANFNSCVEIVGERLGKDAAYILDSSKARKSLGWHENITLDNGLDETISWVTDNLEYLRKQPLSYIHKK